MAFAANNDLNITVQLIDKASKDLKKISTKFDTFGSNVKRNTEGASKFTKTMGVLGGVVGGLAIKEFATFEKQMSKVKAISGANVEEFKQLTDMAKKMGSTTAFTAKEAGDALEFLGMAGLNVKESMDALPGILELASAGNLSLGESADIATNLMAQFGIEAKDIGRVNDVLAKSATSANTSVSEIAEAMKYLGPVADGFQVSLEETAASINVLANSGIKGGMAGQSFSASLLRITKLTPKMYASMDALGGITFNATKAIKELDTAGIKHDGTQESLFLGLNKLRGEMGMNQKQMEDFKKEVGITSTVLFDQKGQYIGLTKTIGFLEEATKDMGDEEKMKHLATVMGIQSTKQWNVLLKGGSKELERYTTMLENSEGAARKMAETQLDNLAGSFTLLKSAVSGLLIEVGGNISTYLRPAIDNLTDLLSNFRERWDGLSPGLQTFIKTIGTVAVVLAGLTIVLGTIGIVLPLLATGFSMVTGAIALLFSPIGLVIAALAAFGLAYKNNFGGFKDFIDGVYTKVTKWASDIIIIWEDFKKDTIKVFDDLKKSLNKFWEDFGTSIEVVVGIITGLYLPTLVKMAISTTVQIAKTVIAWTLMGAKASATATIISIKAIPKMILAVGKYVIATATASIKTGIAWVAMGAKAAMFAVRIAASWLIAFGPIGWATAAIIGLGVLIYKNWDKIVEKTAELRKKLSEIWIQIKTSISNAWSSAMDFIRTKATAVWTGIKDTIAGGVNWAITKINRLITLANKVPGINIQTFSAYEKGGIAKKYETGGIIPGGKLPAHHDQVPAMLDPGELILNRSQQKNIAAQLTTEKNEIITVQKQQDLQVEIKLENVNIYNGMDEASLAEKIKNVIIEANRNAALGF